MIKLREEEQLISIKRRHYMVFILDSVPFVLSFIFLFGVVFYILFYGIPEGFLGLFSDFLKEGSITNIAILFILLISSMLWSVVFMIITNHYLDYWIITNQRTIYTELRGFFSRYYSSISHRKVQDVTADVCGVLPTVFNYGDVKVQTAGAFKNFAFRQVPDPYETKKEIGEAISNYKIKNKDQNE